MKKTFRFDLLNIFMLLFLNLFLFWRLVTPASEDQQVIDPSGDFGLQYYNFSGYQAQRFDDGTLIPQWNPNNFGGNVFLSDPQAAGAYPVRWMFMAIFKGNWSYLSLEIEVIFHYLLASWLMYAFCRTLTGKPIGGMVGALVFAYSSYLHNFPIQQVTILESATWLPLTMLGIHLGTRTQHWRWYVLAGVGMGMTFLAGHPQMAMVCGYFAVAYLSYQSYKSGNGWQNWLRGVAIFVGVAFAIGAIALLPTLEYQQLTTRAEAFDFESKTIGFFFQNTFLVLWTVPGFATYWYIGFIVLVLVGLAIVYQREETLFWIGSGVVAFIVGYGGRTTLTQLFYVLLPGFDLFRNPERTLLVWAFGVAVLASLGSLSLLQHIQEHHRSYFYRVLIGILTITGLYFLLIYNHEGGQYDDLNKEIAGYTLLIAALMAGLLPSIIKPETRSRQLLLTGVLVFDLFSVAQGHEFNYAKGTPENTLSPENPPAWVHDVRELLTDDPFARIDTTDQLGPYATLYGLPDIQGDISPLRFKHVSRLMQLSPAQRWELFAVRYVVSTQTELSVPAEIRQDYGNVRIFELSDPRPLATLVHSIDVILDETSAEYAIAAPDYPVRERLILEDFPPLEISSETSDESKVNLLAREPEKLSLQVETAANAMLLVSIPYHPGWQASVNKADVEVMRADTGFLSIPVEAGASEIEFEFAPDTFRYGRIISLLAWIIVAMVMLSWGYQQRVT